MPSRSDVLLENLDELQQNLLDLWHTLTRDPKKEVWKERAWTVVSGAFAAIAAVGARRAANKIYGILTGEAPPVGRQVPAPSGGAPSSRRTQEPERKPTPA